MLFQNCLTLSADIILKNISNVFIHKMKVKQFKTPLVPINFNRVNEWVNGDNIFFFSWTIPLTAPECKV